MHSEAIVNQRHEQDVRPNVEFASGENQSDSTDASVMTPHERPSTTTASPRVNGVGDAIRRPRDGIPRPAATARATLTLKRPLTAAMFAGNPARERR
jgi:hypothetical protein